MFTLPSPPLQPPSSSLPLGVVATIAPQFLEEKFLVIFYYFFLKHTKTIKILT
jgi:hypothetical protein